MPIDRQLESWQVKTVPGMNNKTEDLDQQDKWVTIAQNCRFENELGTTDKRDPVTFFNDVSLGVGAILGLHRFYTTTISPKFVVVHGTTCYVGDDGAGSFNPIRTGLTDGKRATFQVYRDLLYISNGFDAIFVFDGSTDEVTWEMGACKAVLGSGTGITQTTITYKISFDNDAVISDAISNTIATATNQDIELTNIPLGPAGTVNRKIYRIDSNVTPNFRLVTTIADNSTTTFTDTTDDISAGTILGAATDVIPRGQIIQVHRERFFITVDPNAPNKIYYSNVFLPHFIQQTSNLDFLEIAPEDGDEISGIPIQLGVMVCIKKNTIRRVHVTSATAGAQPETWFADDPIAFVGSPAVYSITQTPVGIFFLSWDHWYKFDGANATPVIGEFDTQEILPAAFSDVVAFWHQGIFLAAYTDLTLAPLFHNRVMRWNVKREKLSFDQWTSLDPSTGINGANVFASKSGDDETGELFYGDSVNGFVIKERLSEDTYRLSTKTEVQEGTQTEVFIGGTENEPYIEPGSGTTAGTIPDDLIIFWDSDSTTPGSGWTEITSTYDGRFVVIDSSVTTTAAANHTHTVSGELTGGSPPIVCTGDQDGGNNNDVNPNHTHAWSLATATLGTEPRHIRLRAFKSASASTTEFPLGAIIMFDQVETPTGWENVDLTGSSNGHYIRIAATNLNTVIPASHGHSYSGNSDQSNSPSGQSSSGSPQSGAAGTHTHSISGSIDSADLSGWELDNTSFHMIKKIGEADTWDGTDKFAYVCVEGAGTPTGWTIDSTFDNTYLKIGDNAVPTAGSAANGTHGHGNGVGGTTGSSSPSFGNAANCRTLGIDNHTHTFFPANVTSATNGEPAQVTFRLFRLQLGKMKDFNAAILVAATPPFIWESPCIEINAEELNEISWNETLAVGDNVTFETRVGATQVACEAASYTADLLSDPNGSPISSTPNVFFGYKMTFTAPDTTVSIPRVLFTDGFVVKVTYSKSATNAEVSVSFKYEIGFRNFNAPMFDKIFKKINSRHTGSIGSFQIFWETENASDTFNVSLTTNPQKFKSYFPSTAMGSEINFRITKTDLNPFRIKELFGLYSPEAEQA